MDWSTRVWVISEYHIAKKKNNFKYWFLQLSAYEMEGMPFFKFDFTDPAFSSIVQKTDFLWRAPDDDPNPAHLSFHRLLIKQLTTQTFFEMMLKSKASKNEDRFYAILPQSKYKSKFNQVGHWKIDNMVSVKLKLFEIMDTNDKWNLLFMSGHEHSTNTYQVLPTFCASNIDWKIASAFGDTYPGNFSVHNNNSDNGSSSAITLQYNSNLRLYYLQLSPREYYMRKTTFCGNDLSDAPLQKAPLQNYLQIGKHSTIHVVRFYKYDLRGMTLSIERYQLNQNSIVLIGSFAENKWILCNYRLKDDDSKWDYRYNDYSGILFNIY
ncbi:hypothetical protein BCR42DRAFT_427163 [Absidia repens]|uniref:Uncharacterized protein n=1 Tax=Absidia repens TaxID=90262 RepID=A0A1X2I069_9FUNG|nr:hypothetical protein BCR42DRAFT_427163 [Absidia repens]